MLTMFTDPALATIPPNVYKHLYPDETEAPILEPQLKDHKPDFPATKIRPIQPVTGCAIEKIAIF